MWPIVAAMGVYCAAYVHDFPGGPAGFWVATKMWMKSLKSNF